MTKKTAGRPSLLTPEVTAKIVHGIVAQGLYAEIAAVNAGVGRSTYMEWRRKGKHDPDSDYGAFAVAIDQALAEAEANDTAAHLKLAHDTAAADTVCPECAHVFTTEVPVMGQVQLTALQWRMQRKYGARWGDRQTVVVETKVQESVEELLDAVKPLMSQGAYVELIDAIASAMGEPGVGGEASGEQAH